MRRALAEKRIQRHPAATAWDKFEALNPDLFNRETIGISPQYLRNRIMHAFMDGYEAGSRATVGGEP